MNDYKEYNNYLSGHFVLDCVTYQNDRYKLFLELLQRRTQETNIVYYDLIVPNIAYSGCNYFLVDLEAVLDVTNCKNNMLDFRQAITYSPIEYKEFVKKLLQAT